MILSKEFVEDVIERNISNNVMTIFSGPDISYRIYTFSYDKYLYDGIVEYEVKDEPLLLLIPKNQLTLEEFVNLLNETITILTEAR